MVNLLLHIFVYDISDYFFCVHEKDMYQKRLCPFCHDEGKTDSEDDEQFNCNFSEFSPTQKVEENNKHDDYSTHRQSPVQSTSRFSTSTQVLRCEQTLSKHDKKDNSSVTKSSLHSTSKLSSSKPGDQPSSQLFLHPYFLQEIKKSQPQHIDQSMVHKYNMPSVGIQTDVSINISSLSSVFTTSECKDASMGTVTPECINASTSTVDPDFRHASVSTMATECTNASTITITYEYRTVSMSTNEPDECGCILNSTGDFEKSTKHVQFVDRAVNTSKLSDSASSLNLDIYNGTSDDDADSQFSDNDYHTNMINEIDGQLNKLTYILNQLDCQLKNLILLSAHNYV